MKRLQYKRVAVSLIWLTFTASPAAAHFHLWDFREVFSSADGSIQFIEFFTTGPFETFATGEQIRSTATGNIFTFDQNLSGSTSNKHLLVATAGFASLPGAVTPDYILPDNFFDPSGDTLRLCGSPCTGFSVYDTRTFASVPTDGVLSRNYPSDTLLTNSPTNFAGASGSVTVITPTGDYNENGVVDAADYVLWRSTLNDSASPAGSGADGDGSGTIDAGDYDYWFARFGNTVPGAGQASFGVVTPEPGSLLIFAIFLATALAAPRFASFANQNRQY